MKYVFIVNPKTGDGKSESITREAIAALPVKDDCEVYVTTAVGDATR